MFQFSGSTSIRLFYSSHSNWVLPSWVPPFGNLRINTYLRFPVAYRSLSRPSSAPDAKAFPLCSSLLQLLLTSSLVLCLSNCMSFANRLFYSIVVHPYLFEKTFLLLWVLLFFECLLYFVTFVTFQITLPWEFFFLTFVCSICFLLFDFQCTLPFRLGGLKWIRTTDLALIRRTL